MYVLVQLALSRPSPARLDTPGSKNMKRNQFKKANLPIINMTFIFTVSSWTRLWVCGSNQEGARERNYVHRFDGRWAWRMESRNPSGSHRNDRLARRRLQMDVAFRLSALNIGRGGGPIRKNRNTSPQIHIKVWRQTRESPDCFNVFVFVDPAYKMLLNQHVSRVIGLCLHVRVHLDCCFEIFSLYDLISKTGLYVCSLRLLTLFSAQYGTLKDILQWKSWF